MRLCAKLKTLTTNVVGNVYNIILKKSFCLKKTFILLMMWMMVSGFNKKKTVAQIIFANFATIFNCLRLYSFYFNLNEKACRHCER